MALESIRMTHPVDPDRAAVEQRVVRAAEADPERFLTAYAQHPEAFGGRYVCADLMKEVIPEYAASVISRGRYNNAVHNTAAVLASEQFTRALRDDSDPMRRGALFLTGSPGSGKTSLVLRNGFEDLTRVLYEGQLVDQSGRAKIGTAIDAGMNVTVVAVLPRIEQAFDNTLSRFERVGRGASIGTMTRIQEGTPAGLEAIDAAFGDRVEIVIHDVRDRQNPRTYGMRDGLALWKEELDRGPTEQRLFDQLYRLRRDGRGSDDFERQARGRPIEAEQRGVGIPTGRDDEALGDEPRRAGSDQSARLLAPSVARLTASPASDYGTYTGPIVATDARSVTQLVDGAHVTHRLNVLTGKTGALAEGKTLTIAYKAGIGTVTDPQQQQQARGRSL